MNDVIVKIVGEPDYPLDVDATLADLTGAETIMLEDYLGSWAKFEETSTRSMIVTIWLAKRQAGVKTTLQEIEQIKGLVFGDTVDIDDTPEEDATNGVPPTEAAAAAIPGTPETSEVIGVGT